MFVTKLGYTVIFVTVKPVSASRRPLAKLILSARF